MNIGTTNNPKPATPATVSPTAGPAAVRAFNGEDLALANRSNIPPGTWALQLTSPVTVVDVATTKQVARSKSGELTFEAKPGVTYGISWNNGNSYVRVAAVAAAVVNPPPRIDPTPGEAGARIAIANVRCFESSNEGVSDRQIALARRAADGGPFALRVWWELKGDFQSFQVPAGLAGAAKIAAAGGTLLATIAAQHPRDGTFRMPASLDAARNAGQRLSAALANAKVPTRTTLLQIFNEVDNHWAEPGGFWPSGNWQQAFSIAAALAEPLRSAGYVCGAPSLAIHDESRMRGVIDYLASAGLDRAFDAVCCNYYAKNAAPVQPTIERSMDLLLAFARPRGLQVWVPECGPQLPWFDQKAKRTIVPATETRVAQLAPLVAQVSRADTYSLFRLADHPAWSGQFVLFDSTAAPNAAFGPWCDAHRLSDSELVVMRAVNAERAKVGLKPLRYHGACAETARRTASAVASAMRGGVVTHDAMVAASLVRAKPGDSRSIGGVSAGSPQDLAQLAADAAAWATSPDHRPLLLDPAATVFGAGVARGTTPSSIGVVPADFFWCAIR